MPMGSSASGNGIKVKKDKEPLFSTPNPNPNPNPNPMPTEEGSSGDAAALSRAEVLRGRSQRAKQLARVYRRHYWSLIEEIRVKHRDYYWEFGKSPLEAEKENENEEGERKRCGFSGCKSKAMPLTRFCHQHILADGKQTLYKPCGFATKSAQSVHITCGKPVLRSTVPCLCPVHFQRIQKQISQALKKAGVSSSSKAPPKFHVLVSECVRQIQAKRRKLLNAEVNADKRRRSLTRTRRWTSSAASPGGRKTHYLTRYVAGK